MESILKDVASLRHVIATLWVMVARRKEFAARLRGTNFEQLTKPVPFLAACWLTLSIVLRAQQDSLPPVVFDPSVQLRYFCYFFIPFAAVFHRLSRNKEGMPEVSFTASLQGWVYVFGLLLLVLAIFMLLFGAPTEALARAFQRQPHSLIYLLGSVAAVVMIPLYGGDLQEIISDVAISLIAALVCYFVLSYAFKVVGIDPAELLVSTFGGRG